MIRHLTYAATLLMLSLTGCGGGSSSTPPPPPPPPPTITSVTANTYYTVVQPGQQAHFTATVQGTGKFSASVKWSVNGVAGGDAVNGTISGGAYTAPAALPPTNPVTITATSVQDPTKSGSVTLTVYTIAISPSTTTVLYNHTKQFTATVTGVASPVLYWQTGYGTVDANGLYTAPLITLGQNATDYVYVNLGNATGPATAKITLQFPPPVLTSITPNGASANELVSITGQDLFGLSSVFFPGPNGTMLKATIPGLPSLTQIDTSVPTGAVSGNVVARFNTGGVTTTAAVPFTRLPNLRIRAAAKDLTPGETLQFQHRLLGASSPTTVNWTTDLGNISTSGLYQAPSVSQETFATVTACLANTRSCDSTMLRIIPLRIAPATPIVGIGQNVQLEAIEGSPVSANWSVLAGGGSIDSSGLFTAPANLVQAGGVPVSASSGNAGEVASIAVTGAFPGLTSRSFDYINSGFDPQQQQFLQRFEGTLVRNLAVTGTRAYALDLGLRESAPFNVNPPFTALEVYDISTPTAPVWMGAAESLSDNPRLFSTYSHYLFEVDTGFVPNSIYNPPSRVALYDIQSNPPQLLSWITTPDLSSAYDNGGVIYATSLNTFTGPTAPIYMFDITGGTIQTTQIDVSPPAGAQAGTPPLAVIGTGNLIYSLFGMQAGGLEIATYDVSVSPPNLLGTTPLNGSILAGFNTLIRGNLLFMANVIFDISNSVPVQVGTAPVQYVHDVKGTRLLGRGFLPIYAAPDNYIVADITNPANPVIQASIYDLPEDFPVGKLIGNGSQILTTQGLGGIATIDVSTPGGQIDKARVGVFPDGIIFDHAISQQTMYVVGASALGSGGLITFDLSSGTPAFSGILLYGQNEALAVQVNNNSKAFMGLLDGLKTIDVSNPTNPFEIGSMALPTNALALSGNVLFDGTLDGRLVTLNVSNPNSPSVLSAVALPGPAVNLRLSGNTLFVADGSAGLLIFNVANPAAPVQLSQFTLSTAIWDVAPTGNLAFLAADSTGLVIVDISNPIQPKQISQTTLESYNPFPDFLDEGPRSVALSVAVQNGLVYVGTANAVGLVFAFDCSQPNYPRLVAMNAFADFIDTLVTGFSFSATDVYVFGSLGVDDDIVQSDNSVPRNAINLYYPPLALRSITFSAAQFASAKSKTFVHPKFDRQLFHRKHRYLRWSGSRSRTPNAMQLEQARNPFAIR